jgi:hypothetical protein
VESVLVPHVQAEGTKPRKEPKQPTENCDGWGTGRCRLVGTHRRLNLREALDYLAGSGDIDEHWAHHIAHCRPAAWAATRDRHCDGNRID